ncbi:hypothetical protein KIN20_019536 [Parelaphostrongylus tenuis]|uniref:Uncharacterized protein n=1 Tax=Parelaphostrongylus tenuis TaxID=148309 RepID=A0AAD5N8U3_PARTN|nr:hypothetical protein KIN20_019536 [Parelaphostrongylus tenuis]
MARLPIAGAFIASVLIITTVLGCGVMPAGQASTRRFTVTGFILPVSMAYSGDSAVRARVPGIASSKDAAVGFVSRLVMKTILDVLEQQGRSALLPDAVISAILDQLRVQISYEPLECKAVTLDAAVSAASGAFLVVDKEIEGEQKGAMLNQRRKVHPNDGYLLSAVPIRLGHKSAIKRLVST